MSNVKVKATKKPVKPVIVVVYILLVILAVIYLAPLLWMLSVSLKDNAGVMSAPFSLPEVFHFENYAVAWTRGGYAYAYASSLIIGFGTAFSVVLLVGLAVYGLYKTDCFFKEFL